jgi:hypothetical protein
MGEDDRNFVPRARNNLNYGTIREQVFEVIVWQALAGAPWREICAGIMQIHSVSPEEIEEEVKRRRGSNDSESAAVPRKPIVPNRQGDIALPLPPPENEDDSGT